MHRLLLSTNSLQFSDLAFSQPWRVRQSEDMEWLSLHQYHAILPNSIVGKIQWQWHSPKQSVTTKRSHTAAQISQAAYPIPSTVNATTINSISNVDTTMTWMKSILPSTKVFSTTTTTATLSDYKWFRDHRTWRGVSSKGAHGPQTRLACISQFHRLQSRRSGRALQFLNPCLSIGLFICVCRSRRVKHWAKFCRLCGCEGGARRGAVQAMWMCQRGLLGTKESDFCCGEGGEFAWHVLRLTIETS